MTKTFTIVPRGSFALTEAAGFGFGPRAAQPFAGTMRLAFCLDDGSGHAGVVLSQAADGVVHGIIAGDGEIQAVRAQVARILSLDGDGEAWQRVGATDPVIGRLQAGHPGLRPVLFHSPYEAAAWSVISARRGRSQAMQVYHELSQALGVRLEVDGEELWAFATPQRLRTVGEFPSLGPKRCERLRAIADAALAGRLDVARLQALGPDGAMDHLQALPGIGPFYAGLIVIRACGFVDVPPLAERRILQAAQHAYGVEDIADHQALLVRSDGWRPFRTWAAVLLRVAFERSELTGE